FGHRRAAPQRFHALLDDVRMSLGFLQMLFEPRLNVRVVDRITRLFLENRNQFLLERIGVVEPRYQSFVAGHDRCTPCRFASCSPTVPRGTCRASRGLKSPRRGKEIGSIMFRVWVRGRL